MKGGNSRVEAFAHHVEKYTDAPELIAEKYAAVHKVAQEHGFVAPRVLDVRSDRISLERLRDMQSLRDLYTSGDEEALRSAIDRAGEVLAILHSALPKSACVQWVPQPQFEHSIERYLGHAIDMAQLPSASLHADYSFTNVLVENDSPRSIGIIDPCPNYGSTFDVWTFGPVYLDIGKMLAGLEGQIPLRTSHRKRSPDTISRLQQDFLNAYQRHGAVADPAISHAFAFAVASAQFRKRFGGLSAVHRVALYNRFKGNFPSYRKQRQVR